MKTDFLGRDMIRKGRGMDMVVCERRKRRRTSRMDNLWSQLPDELLDLIVDHLCLPDLFRFGCVCKPWRNVCDPTQYKNHLPWLIVPLTKSASNTMAFDANVGFFSLRDRKMYKADIPQISNRRICGSFPGGWLMTVHENSEVQLFNPFLASTVISLPPLTAFPRVLGTIEKKEKEDDLVPSLFYTGTRFDSSQNFCFKAAYMRDTYIEKLAMSSATVSNGTVIMAIQGVESTLAFCRIGGDQQEWTPVTPDLRPRFFHDLTYYRGKFYAVHNNGYVVVINGLEEPHFSTSRSIEVVIPRHPIKLGYQYYILESSGDLLVLLRYIELMDSEFMVSAHKSVDFKVLKLDFGTPNKWVEVQSLGDRSLFLGYNTSFSVQANSFSGCKPNCIYFTDNLYWGYIGKNFGAQDMGIFNLRDGSIEKFLYPDKELVVMPPPTWFAPFPAL